MTQKDRNALVAKYLRHFAELERKNTDEVGWIALKFSCSRNQAERYIADAKGGLD